MAGSSFLSCYQAGLSEEEDEGIAFLPSFSTSHIPSDRSERGLTLHLQFKNGRIDGVDCNGGGGGDPGDVTPDVDDGNK